MKTRQRILFALLTAVTLAAVCTLVLRRTLLHAAAAGRTGLRYYVTPKRAIHPGDLVRQDDMQSLPWPAADVVRGAITQREESVNRVALENIAPGQPVLSSQLAPAGSGIGLASRIPNGMRAIALKSDEVIGVAGFLNPGSRVDVLFTSRSGFGSDAVTSTVLQNVEVVATNQQIEPDPDGKPTTATVVTLLLSPSQAQRALLASTQGSLQLVLRNGSDNSTSDAAPIALSQIASSPHGANEPGNMPAPLAMSAMPAAAIPLLSQTAAAGSMRRPKASMPAEANGIEMVYGGPSDRAAQAGMNTAGGK